MVDEALIASHNRRTIEVSCDDGLLLKGSYQELRSAFSNLVINAVKYTNDGDVIHLKWRQDGENIYLDVEDNGIGIETRHLSRLTERFYRADASRSKATGGTGLGLAIVKHVLLHHQGELIITSELGQGSCFTACFNSSANFGNKAG